MYPGLKSALTDKDRVAIIKRINEGDMGPSKKPVIPTKGSDAQVKFEESYYTPEPVTVYRKGLNSEGGKSDYKADNTGTFTYGPADGLYKVVDNMAFLASYFPGFNVSDETRELYIERLKNVAQANRDRELKDLNYNMNNKGATSISDLEKQRELMQKFIRRRYEAELEYIDETNQEWSKRTGPMRSTASSLKTKKEDTVEEQKMTQEEIDKRVMLILEQQKKTKEAQDNLDREIHLYGMSIVKTLIQDTSRQAERELRNMIRNNGTKFSKKLVDKVKELKEEIESTITNEYTTEEMKGLMREWIHQEAAVVLSRQ